MASGGFARRRPGGPAGRGSGAFGAIIAQGEGSRTARSAQPFRTSPFPRPSAASDSWARSLGSGPATAATITLTEASVDRHDAIIIRFPVGAEFNGIRVTPGGTVTDYNPGTRVFAISSNLNTQGVVDAINNQANFPGTAELAPGEPGDRFLLSASYVAAGGSTYYSQVLVATNQFEGDAGNLSIVVADPDAGNPPFTVTWDADDRVFTFYIGGVPLTFPGLVLIGANARTANSALTNTNFGIAGGGAGDDTPASVIGAVVPAGQRIDWSGGVDAGDIDPDPGLGLFVFAHDTDPSWDLRLVERALAEAPAAAGFTVNGAGSGNRLRLAYSDPLETDLGIGRDNIRLFPEDVEERVRLLWNEYPEYRALAADLEYNDAIRFLAATAGAAGNTQRVNMQQGTPPVQAVAAVRAMADLLLGGIIVMRTTWPEANAADFNGQRVQIGPVRAGEGSVRATGVLRQEVNAQNYSELTITAVAEGVAGNDIVVNVSLADNASDRVTVSGKTITVILTSRTLVAALTNRISSAIDRTPAAAALVTTSLRGQGIQRVPYDASTTVSITTSGGVDAASTDVSGTAYWDADSELLYLASDGTVTIAQAVAAINAARSAAATADYVLSSTVTLTYIAATRGVAGNGVRVEFATANAVGANNISVTVSGKTVTVTLFSSSSYTPQAIIDAIAGNSAAAALVSVTVNAAASTALSALSYIGIYPTLAGGADGFPGEAAVAGTPDLTHIPDNQTVTAAGGVTAVAAQPRSPLSLGEFVQNNVRSLIIRGVLPNVDTVQDFIDTYTETTKAFDIEAVGAATDFVVTTPRSAGDTLLNAGLTGGRDADPRRDAAVTETRPGGDYLWTVGYYGASFPADLRTTLAQIEAAFKAIGPQRAGVAATGNIRGQLTITAVEAGAAGNDIEIVIRASGSSYSVAVSGSTITVTVPDSGTVTTRALQNAINGDSDAAALVTVTGALQGGGGTPGAYTRTYTLSGGVDAIIGPVNAAFIQDTETGDQSSTVAGPLPTRFGGGRNRVEASPIEFLKRGADEADGRNIEVRYHTDFDTLENLLDAANDPVRNPDGVRVIEIAGTELEAQPVEPPVTIPMVPGAGSEFELAEEIHEFTWSDATASLSDTNLDYLDHEYLIFEGWVGASSSDQNFFTTSVRRAQLPTSGNNLEVGLSEARNVRVTLTPAGVLTLNPDGANSDSGNVRVWGSNTPSGVARGREGPPGRSGGTSGTGGLSQAQVDARVRALVADWAEVGNTDAAPGAKIPLATDAARGGALAADASDAADFASTTPFIWSAAMIGKLIAVFRPLPSEDEAETGTSTNPRSWSALRIAQAIRAIVPAWARAANPPPVGAFPVWQQLTAYDAGQPVRHTNGTAYVARRDIDDQQRIGPDGDPTNWAALTTHRGEWTPAYYQEGQTTTSNGNLYGAKQDIADSVTDRPEADATNWWPLSVKGSTWTTSAAAPSGGSDGDYHLRTGNTSPGIYYRDSGSWTRILAPSTGGGGMATPLSDATPQASGTAAAGSSTDASRADHVHPFQKMFRGDRTISTEGDVTLGDDDLNTFIILSLLRDARVTLPPSSGSRAEGDVIGFLSEEAGVVTIALDGYYSTIELTEGESLILVYSDQQAAWEALNYRPKPTIPAVPTTEDIQDIIGAMVSGNTETGIAVTYDDANGKLDFVVSGGGTPPAAPDFRVGTRSTNTGIVAADFTLSSTNGSVDLRAYQGERYLLIARLASEPDITSVLFSDDSSQTNQIGVFTKQTATVSIGGDDYNVWVSDEDVSQPTDVTITVR